MDKGKFGEITSDFLPVWNELEPLAILLFGSYAKEEERITSDIDICIVLGNNTADYIDVLSKVWQKVGGKYDVRIFENLPLRIQANVLNDYKIIYCNTPPELGEYFRPYYKKVNTWEHRLKVAYQ